MMYQRLQSHVFCRTIFRAWTQSARDINASVSIIFALCIICFFGLLACAVDLGRAYSVRSAMLAAADNSNFAGIGSTTAGYAASMTMTSDGPVLLAQDNAVKFFDAEIARLGGIAEIDRTATVNKANGLLTATFNFTARINTSFAGVIGFPSISVGGSTTAKNGIPVFTDFYLLLDDSPSMGVAATAKDIQTMVNNTPDQCAFACHDLSNPNNYYELAKKLGVTTRMDVLREATKELFTTAGNVRANPQQFGMAINTFDLALNTVSPVTMDMAAATSSASTIDLFPVPNQGWNNDQITDYYKAMDGMNALIPAPGTGYAVDSRQKVLFMVTDGVADYSRNGKRTIEPIDTALCDTIKKRGISVAVLYTPYLPLPTNSFYNTYVSPFQTQVGPTLARCASPNMYFEVGPNQGIAEAMNTLFLRIVGMAHLTQ